jgi:uncharacterized membrane-anchored protein YitT (DUF2179 family)
MREFVIVYTSALLFGLAVWVMNADIVEAIVCGFALVGAIIFVWVIADEIKSRIEQHYRDKFKKSSDK